MIMPILFTLKKHSKYMVCSYLNLLIIFVVQHEKNMDILCWLLRLNNLHALTFIFKQNYLENLSTCICTYLYSSQNLLDALSRMIFVICLLFSLMRKLHTFYIHKVYSTTLPCIFFN